MTAAQIVLSNISRRTQTWRVVKAGTCVTSTRSPPIVATHLVTQGLIGSRTCGYKLLPNLLANAQKMKSAVAWRYCALGIGVFAVGYSSLRVLKSG